MEHADYIRELDNAHNNGVDARGDGAKISENPHSYVTERNKWEEWRVGWFRLDASIRREHNVEH